jgi:DNA repair photolyase
MSIWARILGDNHSDRKKIADLLSCGRDGKNAEIVYETDFKRFKGQWTWGDTSYNIRDSAYKCKHECKYCYIWPMFARWKRDLKSTPLDEKKITGNTEGPPDIEDYIDFPLDAKKLKKRWRRAANPKMYFFPSSHDIFPENILDYLSVCYKMIDAGHEIMFVTKPHIKGIRTLCNNMELDYKDKFVIFLTITTNNDELLREWEPNAASYSERVKCLRLLHRNDFNVNVMMEPFLSNPVTFIKDLLPYTGIIAVGPMNYSKNMGISPGEIKRLDALYSDKNIRKIYDDLSDLSRNDKIFYKKDFNKRLMRSAGIKVRRKRKNTT